MNRKTLTGILLIVAGVGGISYIYSLYFKKENTQPKQ